VAMMRWWRAVWRVVALVVAAAPLSEVIRRRRAFRAAGVGHADGRHRVHGRHVVRSEICRGVAVVRVVRARRPSGRGRRRPADAPWGWRVLDAVHERLDHVAARRGLCRWVWDADRGRPEVIWRR
jgi:hypothetical protein